jgi:membrane protein DedA with SNARE-associated domain
VEHLVESWGLAVLFLLIGLESAGVPLPGETALVAAAVLASNGHFDIVWVLVVASSAAIVGDNVGYWLGRLGGRRLLTRWSRVSKHTERVLPRAEDFFQRHGGKTVFIGRFVALLRITSAWLAGVSKMPWWRFLLWNAAGGIAWACLIGLIAYYVGKAAADAIGRYGLIGGAVVLVLVVVGFLVFRYWRRRMVGAETES